MDDNDILTEIHRDQMYNLLQRKEREDGRAFDEYRKISIETGVFERAEGSAMVKIGDSMVAVGVKMQPGEPFPDTPDVGVIITNAELIPLASPTFEAGPPGEDAVELARVVDRGVRESGAIDLKKLCLVEGEKVWLIFIDIHILDHGGNLIDASALGAIAALLTTTIPNRRYGIAEEDEPLPVKDMPVSVTMIEFEGNLLVDPDYLEESVASAQLTVISNSDGSLSGIQKLGSGPMRVELVEEAVKLGIEKGKEIREEHLLPLMKTA
ncbi:MAG TPA: exosome complex protein Rrp42 [Candidatus Syntrophoarchaeum butanivorans]|uniref:Exosome complex component Rrp42 n=1 Tax=Candidatus Syntropharchaeum butanivorans TaxID=1839936 RepID=A0A1F2P788_9EURY|nr:MAG: RNase PH-related exoribonuclease [Candidatus Syntrophoarchaeum butanivorans]RJS71657.1 MAG: exosome complex protein Rrp42 [Candidatus Syntrophoarchaeum sp. WYZ-LMO15]HDM35840.1 exosome complex protein Rrp42 [Candidatus Syntrophoarchaeum butanivorans]HEC57525.1 exosome complex protein Rrp42 [Candidatus Syntrophoarchaeum butanivorans]